MVGSVSGSMLLDLLKLGTWKLLWITEGILLLSSIQVYQIDLINPFTDSDAGIASFPVNLRIISPGRVEWVVLRIEK